MKAETDVLGEIPMIAPIVSHCLHEKLGKPAKAEEMFQRAIELDPKDATKCG